MPNPSKDPCPDTAIRRSRRRAVRRLGDLDPVNDLADPHDPGDAFLCDLLEVLRRKPTPEGERTAAIFTTDGPEASVGAPPQPALGQLFDHHRLGERGVR